MLNDWSHKARAILKKYCLGNITKILPSSQSVWNTRFYFGHQKLCMDNNSLYCEACLWACLIFFERLTSCCNLFHNIIQKFKTCFWFNIRVCNSDEFFKSLTLFFIPLYCFTKQVPDAEFTCEPNNRKYTSIIQSYMINILSGDLVLKSVFNDLLHMIKYPELWIFSSI